MAFIPNDKTQKHVDKLVAQLLKEPGKWVYTACGRHEKPQRIYVVETAKSIIELMGVTVEAGPYHFCRVRIKPQ